MEKKYLNIFFSAVFGKTVEKKKLNLFFLLFWKMEKTAEKKIFKFIFSAVWEKRWRK